MTDQYDPPHTKEKSYELDVKIPPTSGIVFHVVPTGLFRCEHIWIDGKEADVVVTGLKVSGFDQIVTAAVWPVPASIFDGKTRFFLTTCPPTGWIEFRFQNLSMKPAAFKLRLKGSELDT